MRKLLVAIFMSVVIIPSSTWALNLNSYVNQEGTVINHTSNVITVTDLASKTVHNSPIAIGYEFTVQYASQLYTQPGQTFTHTMNVYSGADLSPICSVSSSLTLTANSEWQKKPISSNPLRCNGSVYSYIDSKYGKIFGFEIDVKD